MLRRSSAWLERLSGAIERCLEKERGQLPLWVPIALGAGIIAWFSLPSASHWMAWIALWLGVAVGVNTLSKGGRLSAAISIGGVLLAAGCMLVWGKALMVGEPPLGRPAVVEFSARVLAADPLVARGLVRLDLEPLDRKDLPGRVRVNAQPEHVPEGLAPGETVSLRARLMPPAPAALPGSYDFAQRAYFSGIGATGRALESVERVGERTGAQSARNRVAAYIGERVSDPERGIAIALATGNQSWISESDAEAMRRSGLAHLLSISGLHVSALIGGVIFILVKVLALSPYIALRWPILMIAACVGGAAGVGYTLFTGAEVPTIRSCIAALLVIGGMALGREAIGLRLIATGALVVMIFWPETIVGPSFQMSFAAVVALVALYEYPPARTFFERREEGRMKRLLRALAALFATGLVVELVLTPIAFAHFHRSGALGAAANIVAIPLTSFIVMPAEVLALVLDVAGLGAPAWWIVEMSLKFLLWLAHYVADQPYATLSMPMTSGVAFPLAMIGLLWLMLWHTRIRWLGIPVGAVGFALTLTAPVPDVLVTADGRHVAIRTEDGSLALLRERAGDYVRSTLAEAAGYEGEFAALADAPGAHCSKDMCEAVLERGAGSEKVRLLITRSDLLVPYPEMIAACSRADIVIASRRMPKGCEPRWAKLDRPTLAAMGGALVHLDDHKIIGGRNPRDGHPWVTPQGR
jgi:competence protein ComEC